MGDIRPVRPLYGDPKTPPAMPRPEACIGNASAPFDEDGGIKVEETRGFLAKVMESFAAGIAATARE